MPETLHLHASIKLAKPKSSQGAQPQFRDSFYRSRRASLHFSFSDFAPRLWSCRERSKSSIVSCGHLGHNWHSFTGIFFFMNWVTKPEEKNQKETKTIAFKKRFMKLPKGEWAAYQTHNATEEVHWGKYLTAFLLPGALPVCLIFGQRSKGLACCSGGSIVKHSR